MPSQTVLLLFFGLISFGACDKCFSPVSRFEVDIKKFCDGVWYEIQRTQSDWELVGQCAAITHAMLPDHTKMFQSYHYDSDEIDMAAEVMTDENNVTHLSMSFAPDNSTSNYYVLQTDYDDYALVYSCYESPEDIVKERIWILSRHMTIKTNETWTHIQEAIDEQGKDFLQIMGSVISCEGEQPQCLNITSKAGLNISEVFSGDWYEVVRSANTLEGDGNMISVNYQLNGDSLLIKHKNERDDVLFLGFGKIIDDYVSVPLGIGERAPSKYWVVDTDYQNFAVIYSCGGSYPQELERVWILSRTLEVPEQVFSDLPDGFGHLLEKNVTSSMNTTSPTVPTTIDTSTTVAPETTTNPPPGLPEGITIPGSSYRYFFLFQFETTSS